MTMEEIKACKKDYLVPTDIAGILGCCAYNSFPFPTIMIGTRVKIPRIAFIRAMEGISYEGVTA